jgi:hypothetical protein
MVILGDSVIHRCVVDTPSMSVMSCTLHRNT